MIEKKIYISGKITSLDHSQTWWRFFDAELVLLNQGWDVVNPMRLPKCNSWTDYMLQDIKVLFTCDAIYMLNNWHTSPGARIERAIAF